MVLSAPGSSGTSRAQCAKRSSVSTGRSSRSVPLRRTSMRTTPRSSVAVPRRSTSAVRAVLLSAGVEMLTVGAAMSDAAPGRLTRTRAGVSLRRPPLSTATASMVNSP